MRYTISCRSPGCRITLPRPNVGRVRGAARRCIPDSPIPANKLIRVKYQTLSSLRSAPISLVNGKDRAVIPLGMLNSWCGAPMKEKQYLALLRGMNVGGNNIITMTALKACFEKLGLMDVATYIQSGNVLFRTAEKDLGRLTNTFKG